MVKLRGNEKHKVCKKTRKFNEIRGKFAKNRGELIIFPKKWGIVKCTETTKIGGIQNL